MDKKNSQYKKLLQLHKNLSRPQLQDYYLKTSYLTHTTKLLY